MILLPTIENAFNGKDKEAEIIGLATEMMINEGEKSTILSNPFFRYYLPVSVASDAQYQNDRNRLLIEKWISGRKIQQTKVRGNIQLSNIVNAGQPRQ